MTKWKLIALTLDQLVLKWKRDPHSHDQFDLQTLSTGINSMDTTIKWNPNSAQWVPELPRNNIPKAVNVAFRKTGFISGLFSCCIVDTASALPSPRTFKEIISERRKLATLTRMHCNFKYLQKEITRYKKTRDNNSFLEDLMKVFPRTLDGAILGDEYDE